MGLQVSAESGIVLAAAKTNSSGKALLKGGFSKDKLVTITVVDETGRFQTNRS